MSMAVLTASAARFAGKFGNQDTLNNESKAGIIVGLFIVTLLSNACGVKVSPLTAG